MVYRVWINNIKKLDSKNHLKHGEFYARDGSVHDLVIDNNNVSAKVEGAPGDVYDVEINFKKMSEKDKKFLSDYIKTNPVIFSNLLNNKLSDELFKSRVKLFPDSLKDFKMSCTCNKNLFCKHKAAVFHKIAIEISKNPFLIFTLLDFDLNELIQDETYKIKNIRDILKQNYIYKLGEFNELDYLNKLKFSLTDYPIFYPSKSVNFNDILCNTVNSMSDTATKILNNLSGNFFIEYIIMGPISSNSSSRPINSNEAISHDFEVKWSFPRKWSQFRIDVNGNYEIIKILTGVNIDTFINSDLKYHFFAFFAEISQVDLEVYCEDIQFLHELYIYTLYLIRRNALIPQFFKLDNNEYHIRWIPVFDTTIYEELEYFFKNCPDKLITFYENKLSKYNQVLTIISLFFEGFCKYFMIRCIPQDLSVHVNETYFRLFFLKSQDFSSYIYKGKEIEIDNWLAALYLIQQDYKFIINSHQENYNFVLELKIDLNGELYDYEDMVKLNRMDIIKNLFVVKNILSKFSIDYDLLNLLSLDLKDFSYFSDNVAPMLRLAGVEVNEPEEFSNVQKVKLVLDTKLKDVSASLSIDNLADFDWKIAIGDEKYDIDEFESFSTNYRGLIKIRNKYFVLNELDLMQLLEDIGNIPAKRDKASLLSYLLSNKSDNVEFDDKLNNLIESMLNIDPVSVPKSLNGTLRDYQEVGFSWLVQNMQSGFGSILADDMGLGKTIQILSLILYLKENNILNDSKVLIVVPTSILTNWTMEVEKFAPSLKVEVYHGVNRYLPDEDFDILLTSYGIVRRDHEDLMTLPWYLMVVDEAQNIKNPNTKQTKAVKSIDAQNYIALSGTPIENHLDEYWSIFDFTNKGYLKSLTDFKRRFITPIEKHKNKTVLEDFKLITSPFILRRLKTDKRIISELPDKFVNDIYCNLTVKQASIYDETLELLIQDIEENEGIKRKGLVLKLITSLKQICNHPSQFLKIDDAKISDSGKMEVLVNLLETIIGSGEKVLIFTQYVQMGNIMKMLLEKRFKQEVLFLHGKLSRQKRDEIIDKFQNGKAQIFILSLKTGGIGLNLTAASNVIHYDLWWNPAVENQATDRAYRIGQTENVMVYRFITKGTLEERINQILIEKMELVDMAVGSEEAFITEMSNEELRQMLDLRNS